MKLEKLLAENMLRFGTKNLIAANVKPYLMEQGIKVYTLSQLPAALESSNYTPSPANYIVISDGNPWLAQNRAVSLKNFLAKNVEQQVKIPFDADSVTVEETAVSPNKGDQYQYVEGTLYALLEKPGIPLEKYRFQLTYNFYELDNKPYIVVTKRGAGSPVSIGSDPKSATGPVTKLTKDGASAIKNGGFIIFQRETGLVGNIAILVPVPKWYASSSKGRLYFKDEASMIKTRDFIQQYTEDLVKMPRESQTADLVVADFTNTTGGNGNYIAGKGGFANVEVMTGDKAGTQSKLHRSYQEYGDGVGKGVDGTGTKPERIKIGTLQLTKEDGAFLDNMITIQPGAYQKIFDELKTAIAKYTPEYNIVSITASVKGYASADRSTNRLPRGITQPDHTYGGAVPAQYWVVQ